MSSTARRADLSLVQWRYRRWGTPGVCYYCGCLAHSYDHVPPVSLAPIEDDKCEHLAFWLIPACNECNVHVGALPVLLVGARKAHLARVYRRRFRKALAVPDWEPDELARLRYGLRTKIETGLALRDAMRARIDVLERECLEPTLEDYRERLGAQ